MKSDETGWNAVQAIDYVEKNLERETRLELATPTLARLFVLRPNVLTSKQKCLFSPSQECANSNRNILFIKRVIFGVNFGVIL